MRRQPTAKLLDVRAEAIRWEHEGLQSIVRNRSNSVPSFSGIQYGVQGSRSACVSHSSEMSEMKEMLRQQQEQLKQLTQTIAKMQHPHPHGWSAQGGPVLCRRCKRPGHFAREYNNVYAPFRPQPSAQAPQLSGRQPESTPVPEN